ncbi:Lar family restriction alleviation protein [Burkholderia ubonensis]|uniref:Lar family restriction alleviation protein n=1 Tax=Burkholderia ubonensis TaxID=101571 RepID=UPI000AB626A8|nr:Lar family restriction alleviation protein [Burkholderia ubonensis]
MALEAFEPDALELRIASTTHLPACPFCSHNAIMASSVNRDPIFGKEPVFQTRIACTNHNCNASVVANERTREEAQQHAIAQWTRRAPTQQPSGESSLKNPMVRFPTEEDIRAWEEARKRQPSGETASAGVIAAALAVIEADRAHVLTDDHVDALDIAIKIQRGTLKLPQPSGKVTGGDKRDAERYRALRDPGPAVDGLVFASVYSHPEGCIPSQRLVRGKELDRLADAARAQGGEQS